MIVANEQILKPDPTFNQYYPEASHEESCQMSHPQLWSI